LVLLALKNYVLMLAQNTEALIRSLGGNGTDGSEVLRHLECAVLSTRVSKRLFS